MQDIDNSLIIKEETNESKSKNLHHEHILELNSKVFMLPKSSSINDHPHLIPNNTFLGTSKEKSEFSMEF